MKLIKIEKFKLFLILTITYLFIIISVAQLSNDYNSLKYLESLKGDMIELDNSQLPLTISYEDKIKSKFNINKGFYYVSISFLIISSLVFLRQSLDEYNKLKEEKVKP